MKRVAFKQSFRLKLVKKLYALKNKWVIPAIVIGFLDLSAIERVSVISSEQDIQKIVEFCSQKALLAKTTIDLSDPLENYKAMIAAYYCEPGDCVIDVGSNVGDFAIYYQKLVGEGGSIFAYEANPYIFDYLANRVSMLDIHNIFVSSKAASSSTGEKLLMKVYDSLSGICTVEPLLMNEGRMPGKTKTVVVETEQLNDLLSLNISPVRLIKIDVEGHEHAVLKGAERLLNTHRPLVIFEYGYLSGVWEPDTIHQMEELGYFVLDLKTNKRVARFYSNPLTDLLAIPVEKVEELLPLFSCLYQECVSH